jgi:hypothetical protein
MNSKFHPLGRLSGFERRFLVVAWLMIVAKCAAVWWVIPHYHVPIHPMWVIGPTVFFAAWVTALWVTHHE